MILTIFSNRAVKEWKETYLWALKKNRGMMALLTLLLMIALPVVMIVAFSNKDTADTYFLQYRNEIFSNYTMGITTFLLIPILLLFVLVISASLFSYLHQKRSVDMFHSIPVGRTPLLLGRWCAALTLLFLPLLFSYAAAAIVGLAYGVEMQYCLTAPMVQLPQIMLMVTAALTFSVFMAVCAGTTFDMILSIFAINAAYPLLIFAGAEFTKLILPGFNLNVGLNSILMTALAPFVAACLPFPNSFFTSPIRSSPTFGSIDTGFLTWWIVMTVVLLAASILLYKHRKSECAESGFAFAAPKITIRFLVTAVTGIGMGMVFHLSSSGFAMFFIGVFLGSLTAHIVVEAVYSRGFKQLKKSFIYYGGFVALFLVFYGILATGCFGYDTRVPRAEDVESISFSSISSPTRNSYYYGNSSIIDTKGNQVGNITPCIKNQNNIKTITQLIQEYVNTLHQNKYPYSLQQSDGESLALEYHLKNGATIRRTYRSMNSETVLSAGVTKIIDQIVRLPEYVESSSLAFYVEPEMIKSVDLTDKQTDSTFAPEERQKEELLQAIRKDLLNSPAEQNATEDSNRWLSVEFRTEITPTAKLKELTGNRTKPVNLDAFRIQLGDNTPNVNTLLKKFGWED